MSFREDHFLKANRENYTQAGGVDLAKITMEDLMRLWRQTMNNGMHGICFSIYEDGQEPGDTITKEQVERRIQILNQNFKWIRSFSCIEGNEFVPQIAHKHGLKTLVGAWLSDDLEKNELSYTLSICFI